MLNFLFASFNIYTVNWTKLNLITCGVFTLQNLCCTKEDFVAAHALDIGVGMIMRFMHMSSAFHGI